MDTAKISAALFAAAEDQARLKGLKLGGGADSIIRARAEAGARSVLERVATQDAPEAATLAEATASFRRLVDAMAAARNDIPGYAAERGTVIGEETLARALNSLCPIWPIC